MNDSLAPPSFYLSRADKALQVVGQQSLRFWLFTDVRNLTETWSGSPNVQPLQGQNAPYVSQGSGGGFRWRVSAKINPWHSFYTDGGVPDSHLRPNPLDAHEAAYNDYASLLAAINEYGPNPLFLLHKPRARDWAQVRTQTVVALTTFGANIPMAMSGTEGGQQVYPSIIPVELVLIERQPYRVRVSA